MVSAASKCFVTLLSAAMTSFALDPPIGYAMDHAMECQRLAGSVDEPNNPRKLGVPLAKIDTLTALKVCQEAHAVDPGNPAVVYRLARAFTAPGPRQSISHALHYQRLVWGLPKRAAAQIGPEAAAWYAASGKRALTFSTYVDAAEKGNLIAQMSLAYMHTFKYYNSEMQEPDFKKAIYWMRKAADQGYAPAQDALGGFFSHEGEHEEAIVWYTRASEQNYPNAFLSLGLAFDKGLGVSKDDRVALEMLSKAAHAGLTYAQLVLARKINNGEGIERSPELALKWYKIAADAGDPDAKSIVGKLEAEKRKDDQAIMAMLAIVGLLALIPGGDANMQPTTSDYNDNWIDDWEANNRKAIQDACAWLPDDQQAFC